MSANLQAIVLAAGKSTGFKTGKTKLIEKLCGQEMILYTTRLMQQMNIKAYVVVGYQKEIIEDAIKREHADYFEFIEQEEQHGTAHAILCSNKIWDKENILIMYGDMPLITQDLLDSMYKKHKETDSAITVVTSHTTDPMDREYARVIKKDGRITIVQASELADDIMEHCCVDAGIYIIKKSFLQKHIETIQKNQDSQEFHMSDIVNIASEYSEKITTIPAPFDVVRGINTLQELWAAEQVKRSELIRYWMDRGVRFSVAQNVHVDLHVTIGAGSFIGCGAHLIGKTVIGKNCTIMEFSSVEHSVLGDNVTINTHCLVQNAHIESESTIGPFAHIHSNATIAKKTEIGNFTEAHGAKGSIQNYTKLIACSDDTQSSPEEKPATFIAAKKTNHTMNTPNG